MTRMLLVVAIAAVAVAAAIAANILLLSSASASNDPVGRLSPVHLPAPPPWTIRPIRGHPHDEGADD